MRLKITLKTFQTQTLSFNWQQLMSAAIYDILSDSDKQFAGNLHEKGFNHPLRLWSKHKSFVFSKLYNLKFSYQKGDKHMTIQPCMPYFFLSVYNSEVSDHFISGIFRNNSINLTTFYARIEQVYEIPEIAVLPTMQLRTLSPIYVREHAENINPKASRELSPDQERFFECMMESIITKYEIYHHKKTDYGTFDYKILSDKPKSTLIWIKNIGHKAFFLDFELTCQPNLMAIGLQCGFGALNSQGFGYCVPLNQENI